MRYALPHPRLMYELGNSKKMITPFVNIPYMLTYENEDAGIQITGLAHHNDQS